LTECRCLDTVPAEEKSVPVPVTLITSSVTQTGGKSMNKYLLKLSVCLLLAAPGGDALAGTIYLGNNLSAEPGDTFNVPVFVSDGAGITDITFGLDVDFTRLSVTGGTVNPALPGATFAVTTAGSGTAGTVTTVFHSQTPLASGGVELGELVGFVPNNAPLGPTTLHFNDSPPASINGGAITANTVDGVFTVTAVPEPSTVTLVGLGLLGLLLVRKKIS
jgi:hypothetical protein